MIIDAVGGLIFIVFALVAIFTFQWIEGIIGFIIGAVVYQFLGLFGAGIVWLIYIIKMVNKKRQKI